ncbi:hypothetical protein KCG55_09755 [Neisseria subflava]|uniref:hypothetical protein n=1 Tax=Neisseria subflava TaxID=28449 RepID=UPI0020B63D92|nr:hypothetical protein [Neisseria subflava]UTG73756.1 hypothetical protein KCG55_09755 [Neisseria subflava]
MFFLRTLLLSASVGALMAGCANQSAPDFPSSWKPLNELPDQVTEIPLVKPHVYQVTRLDTTVKGLLERWGEEAKMPVVYDYTLDFTLYKKVSTIRNTELDNALSELSKLYEDKGMVFYVQNGVIMAHKKMDVAVKNSGKKKYERSAKADVKTQD